MKRTLAFLSLFTSLSTLLCCAIPALFVALGFGAAFAGILGAFPQLIWISDNKTWIFGMGAVLILSGGIFQRYAVRAECPVDPERGEACKSTRDWSKWIYIFSILIYLVGSFFAFIAPRINQV